MLGVVMTPNAEDPPYNAASIHAHGVSHMLLLTARSVTNKAASATADDMLHVLC
jgi:hypothetical protein